MLRLVRELEGRIRDMNSGIVDDEEHYEPIIFKCIRSRVKVSLCTVFFCALLDRAPRELDLLKSKRKEDLRMELLGKLTKSLVDYGIPDLPDPIRAKDEGLGQLTIGGYGTYDPRLKGTCGYSRQNLILSPRLGGVLQQHTKTS